MNQYKSKIKCFTEEVWNKKNFQVFDKMIHPDFQYNDPIYPNVNSKDEYKAFISRIQKKRYLHIKKSPNFGWRE